MMTACNASPGTSKPSQKLAVATNTAQVARLKATVAALQKQAAAIVKHPAAAAGGGGSSSARWSERSATTARSTIAR